MSDNNFVSYAISLIFSLNFRYSFMQFFFITLPRMKGNLEHML